MTKRGSWDVVTYDDNCAADNKPATKQKCRPLVCDNEEAEWFITDWSKVSLHLIIRPQTCHATLPWLLSYSVQ